MLRLVGSCSVTEVLVVSAQTQQTAVSWTMSEYTGGARLDTKHAHNESLMEMLFENNTNLA